ncbi:hypothetical protein HC028_18070 [Planosporangium flavigriseum]|uniref:Uncharacterized protein n=1 Tax=Planosporangium flavigriseum TaxID=373681 RepID=A0A8J3LV78_9ACTN|nr:hypothetical protein [Planosporangium flavigriseum]NJC66398.1 hypothetical protein [Planosporangium flavigriseum]GIG74196.1 hypothetical protein Pfl04_26000 [Planosporangium flavigriseum]
MTNIQQPEMRRSEHDPLVTDHAEETAQNALPPGKDDRALHKVPEDQRTPYEPPPKE